METLPKDVLIEMALNLSPPDLISFCASSKTQNKIICQSETFWRRKLQKDYPEEFLNFYQTGNPIKNPREVYINRFTLISREIENFVDEFIDKVFPEFKKFLNKDYKSGLYKAVYSIYEEAKQLDVDDDYDDNLWDIINNYISLFQPDNMDFQDDERNPLNFTPKFIEYLLFIEQSNKTKRKMVEKMVEK